MLRIYTWIYGSHLQASGMFLEVIPLGGLGWDVLGTHVGRLNVGRTELIDILLQDLDMEDLHVLPGGI